MLSNAFCDRSDLANEASVEQFFVSRLLAALSYSDAEIKPKNSIEELTISLGRRRVQYRPDYALVIDGQVRWVVDAKAVAEDPLDWVDQCASYCLFLRRRGEPADHFAVTNGIDTYVFRHDGGEPVLHLTFADFVPGNAAFAALKQLLGREALARTATPPAPRPAATALRRPSSAEISAVFSTANDYIYKNDNISPAAAFQEFVKIVFVKIWSDRQLHERYPTEMEAQLPIPSSDIRFSSRWLDSVATSPDRSPLDTLLFQELVSQLENEIARGRKKRIYPSGERIRLLPETIRGVVQRLERFDLFGIDEDLNGRLFESFLSSTMRGEELGQYFTPRSIVKLATGLASLRAGRNHVDKVIDACCGTGGFLIDALATLTRQIQDNSALSPQEKTTLIESVRSDAVFGMDAGREPAIARIARINMYLHGDGGSRIYLGDALDKRITPPRGEDPEIARELDELRRLVVGDGIGFDVVLTNPPFAKEYNPTNAAHARLLADYDLWAARGGRRKIRSALLFIERYRDLLNPGGRLLTIIDDNVLGGRDYLDFRDFLRRHFIVRAVVSLPGDAFQRSKARVKTSLLYLVKKAAPTDAQPAAFMYYAQHIGIDDTARKRVIPDDAVRHQRALEEIQTILTEYNSFAAGSPSRWSVPGTSLADRLDVKFHLLKPGRQVSLWTADDLAIANLDDLVDLVTDEIRKEDPAAEDELQLFLIEYSGAPVPTEKRRLDEMTYSSVTRVATGDIVVSHINAVNGAIGVVPDELDGAVVSPEYSVMRPKSGVDPHLISALLRSPEIRADILSRSSGIGRHRVEWGELKRLQLPRPPSPLAQSVGVAFTEALRMEREARSSRIEAQRLLEGQLHLASPYADEVLNAFKPPR